MAILTLLVLIWSATTNAASGTSADDKSSADPLLITSELESVGLTPHLALLEDPENKLSFEQVSSPQFNKQFKSTGGESPNFGFTTSTWWVRVTLVNPYSKAMDVIFRQDYPLIDYLDFWSQKADGNWEEISTGDLVKFDQRPIDHRVFLFPHELPADSSQTFYFRFQTQGSMNIGLFVHSPLDLMNMIGEEYLALGIYYGGFIVLMVYNLIMFITVRERTFAHYLLYVLSYGLYMSVHNGLSFQFLWPDNTWLANQSLLILLALSLLGGLQFTRSILMSRVVSPRLDRIAKYLELMTVACLLASPFVKYHAMIVPLAVLTLVIAVQAFTMGIAALMSGSAAARYYVVAFSLLLLGVVIYMLKTFGLLPHNAFTQNAFQIGSLIEMVLLSLAVASRLNEFKRKTYKDALTHLYNRRYFDDQSQLEYEKARQHTQPLSMVVIDIDNFKVFNDTHGHAKGDSALKLVASILLATVRKPNTPCRYGGEEFVLILPQTSPEDVAVLTERIRSTVESETADDFGLTVSLGYATLQNDNFNSASELFIAADFALYTAKETGRNKVVDYRSCDLTKSARKQSYATTPGTSKV